jgi:hypothetical protein
MSSEATLFVFYKLSPDGGSWTYSKMPKQWWWVGKGGTSPTIDRTWVSYFFPRPKPEYPREEQFQGTKATQTAMREYLDAFFRKLQKAGTVLKYRIRTTCTVLVK